MPRTYISAAMRAAVGRELGRRVSFPVSESDIRRWAIAVYYPQEPPRLFWDAGYAKSTRYGGIVAPEDFNPFAWMAAGQDPAPPGGDPPGAAGTPGAVEAGGTGPAHVESLLGIPGPGLRHQLNGGIDVEYGARMRPGNVITSLTRLVGYAEREGRLGQMLFTTTQDTWTSDGGELVKVTRMTVIRY